MPYIIRSSVEPHPLRGYMNMGRYKVKGKNPETGRASTKTVYAVDETDALKVPMMKRVLLNLTRQEKLVYLSPLVQKAPMLWHPFNATKILMRQQSVEVNGNMLHHLALNSLPWMALLAQKLCSVRLISVGAAMNN